MENLPRKVVIMMPLPEKVRKKRPDIFKPFWMAVMFCRVYHTRSIFASRSDETHLFISSSDPTLVVSFQHLLFFD